MATPNPAMRKRFYMSLGIYAVLALAAWRTIGGGKLLWGVWILLGALALLSWTHLKRVELE